MPIEHQGHQVYRWSTAKILSGQGLSPVIEGATSISHHGVMSCKRAARETTRAHRQPNAARHIGGYVIFNDITARDIQRREMESANFCFSKSIDSFCPLDPWIVIADEIPDPYNLALELRVNGEKRQIPNSSHMSVTIPQIIAKCSPAEYSAGDIISTGTVSGVAAFSADPEAWYLKPGDLIEAEIER